MSAAPSGPATALVLAALLAALGCSNILGLEDHTIAPDAAGVGACVHRPTSEAGAATEDARPIASDEDDGMWYLGDTGVTEALAWIDKPELFVSTDQDQQRAAFRFQLDVPRCSTIESAVLELSRHEGSALAGDRIEILTWDTADVAAFNPKHKHGPELHAERGLALGISVVYEPPINPGPTETPDVSVLLQYVVDLPDFASGKHVGLLLEPLALSGFIGFYDSSSSGPRARLRYSYVPPP